jgi:hypothetical protein
MGNAVSNAVSNARIVHVFEFEYHSTARTGRRIIPNVGL